MQVPIGVKLATYWGYIGRMEHKTETIIWGFRVQGFGFRRKASGFRS